MASPVRLDRRGMAELAKSAEVADEVEKVAEQVAANVRKQGRKVTSGADLPVEVSTRTTDRAVVDVTINHPAGVGMQAKHGVLTKAASEAGLEVRGE